MQISRIKKNHRLNHGPACYLVGTCGAGAMALEGKVVLGIGWVDVLDGDASLDAAEREAGRLLGLLVSKDGDAAVLVFERRLDALELGRLALQRVEAHEAVRRGHHRHGVVHVGAVAALRQVHRHYRHRAARVPELGNPGHTNT